MAITKVSWKSHFDVTAGLNAISHCLEVVQIAATAGVFKWDALAL